jgi:hypothetical protein
MMETKRPFGKIIGIVCGINLLLVLIYTILLMAVVPGQDKEGLAFLFLMAFTVGLHAALCLIAGIVFFIIGKGDIGAAFLLAMLAVGIIGFSACFGGAQFLEGRLW